MSWITLTTFLVSWCLIALSVAHLFGRWVRTMEVPEETHELASAVVSYLDRAKRAKRSSRAVTEARRSAGGGRRH
jgi:hypothetical protein